jgi:NDP-sugar pyrophosphorylase family protein
VFLNSSPEIEESSCIISWGRKEIDQEIARGGFDMKVCEVPLSDTGTELATATERLGKDEDILVLNGDTLTNINLSAFINAHRVSKLPASIALVRWENIAEYGEVVVEGDRAVGFREKSGEKRLGLVNAGVYILKAGLLKNLKASASLERDVFPNLAKERKLHAFLHDGYMFDMGTPDRIEVARAFFER